MVVQKYDIRRPESAGGDFEERYWSLVNSPVFDAAGELRYIVHRADDVTEFVRLEHLESSTTGVHEIPSGPTSRLSSSGGRATSLKGTGS